MQNAKATTEAIELPTSKFLKEEEVAHMLSVDMDFMRLLRKEGNGPAWSDLDGYIRYQRKDLENWLAFRGEVSDLIRDVLKQFSAAELAAELLSRDSQVDAIDKVVTFILMKERGLK